MKTINIVDVLGTTNLLTSERGTYLRKIIETEISNSPVVNLDFAGYEFVSSSFINSAFGDLCLDLDWSVNDFYKKINLSGIDEDDKNDIELSIFNAKHRKELIKSGKNLSDYYPSTFAY